MKVLIYDVDAGHMACADAETGSCPRFLLNEQSETVIFQDKLNNTVEMMVVEFNKFVTDIKNGIIKKINPLLRCETRYNVGTITFFRNNEQNMIVMNSHEKIVYMSITHFNLFIDAVFDDKMIEQKIKLKNKSTL